MTNQPAHLPPDPLQDPVRAALLTSHQALAQQRGQAWRYPAAIAPFAAVTPGSPSSIEDLRELLLLNETIFLVANDLPLVPGLVLDGTVPCLQMLFPQQTPVPQPVSALAIDPLSCADTPAMLALIAVAYPGYFRAETCRMGRYFGIRDADGTLIAMGGERLVAAPWRELSALCVHPAHAGRGLGSALLAFVLRLHREEGSRSWLWVVEQNERAIRLYRRFGFETIGHTTLQRLRRVPAEIW